MGRANRAGTFVGMGRYRVHAFLALLALACAQGWNRWNIAAMSRSPQARHEVIDGRALASVDAASYLQAVDRMLGDRPDLEQGPMTDRVDLRTPGYRIWYLLPRLLLQPMPALTILVWLQCLMYALTVALLWEVMLRMNIATGIRWPLVIAFAAMPTFHGFLFHTLTEGVTPSLSLIVLCSALMGYQTSDKRWLMLGLITWSLLLLTRPALVWVGLALLPSLKSSGPVRATLLVMLAMLPTLMWLVMNSIKAGTWVGLHPVYRVDEPGINRPVHGAFWELAKSWGASGDAFHEAMEPAFRAALACDTTDAYAQHYTDLAPRGMLTEAQREATTRAFHDWQRFNCLELGPALRSPSGTLHMSTALEARINASLEHITSDWRNEHPFHSHVVVPVKVLLRLIAHSNLNLFLFQHELRGIWWMEVLRWLSALLHVALFCCVVLALLPCIPSPTRWAAAGAVLYLIYLAYVQRGVEERYTLPVLFIGVACAAFLFSRRDAEARRTHRIH